MEKLDKFLPKSESDFNLEKLINNNPFEVEAAQGSASQTNMASYLALMSSDSEGFKEALPQILSGEQSLDQMANQIREEDYNKYVEATADIVADPELDDGTKQAALGNLSSMDRGNYNFMTEYAIKSISEPSERETPRQAQLRLDMASEIDNIVQNKQEMQKILNISARMNDADTVNALVDFTEYMLPFVEGFQVAGIRSEYLANQTPSTLFSIFARGSAKKEILEAFKKMPIDKRVEAARKLSAIVSSNTNITSMNQNDFAKTDLLRSFLEEGYYTTADEVLDNITGVLDLIGLGTAAAKVLRGIKRAVVSNVQPASPSQIAGNTNAGTARRMHDDVVEDETGDVAEALYGTNRDDAITHDLAPQVLDEVVEARALIESTESSIKFTSRELESAPENVGVKFGSQLAEGIGAAADKLRKEFVNRVSVRAVQVGQKDGNLSIRASYGPPEGGWGNAEDALELTALALRNNGVTVNDLQLMVRQGDEYVPMSLQEWRDTQVIKKALGKTKRGPGKGRGRVQTIIERPNDYFVSLDLDRKVSITDVTSPERWATKGILNFFDRVPFFVGKQAGSISRVLFDPASLLPKVISAPASLAKDRSALLEENLLKVFQPFSDRYIKMDAPRQGKVEEYLKQANNEGFWDDTATLVAKGFTGEEIQALKAWRKGWDISYQLENADLRKTLQRQGYYVLENAQTQTRLYAKPLVRQQAGEARKAYNPVTDSMEEMTSAKLTELYNEGGQVAKLRRPIRTEDGVIEYVVSKNVKNDYFRALNDTDTVLNYRKGYYSIKYDAPWFIDEIVRDEVGNELYRKAVGVAGSLKEAQIWSRNARGEDGGLIELAEPRNDKTAFDIGSDTYFDLQQSIGRSSQKFRGDTLEDASNLSHMGTDHQYVKSPIDTVLDNSRSLANRTSMRDTIETMKYRFMNNYGHLLGGAEFKRKFPMDSKEIGAAGAKDTVEAADARTLWEYINYLENGYIDSIDESWKAVFNTTANALGKITSVGEKGVRAVGSVGPVQLARSAAFTTMIAWAPLRQIFVQGNQATQLAALEPKYFGTKLFTEMAMVTAVRTMGDKLDSVPLMKKSLEEAGRKAGVTLEEAKLLAEQYKASGLSAAIDKSNLVREVFKSVSDYSILGNPNHYSNKIARGAGKAAKLGAKGSNFLRRVGFDTGEEIVMSSAWLTFHHRALQKNGGVPLTQRELDKVTVAARNFTGNMNAAGDMGYNQNFMKIAFQFFQVPHKMLLNVTTNPYLSGKEKAILAAYNLGMYSLPVGAMYSIFGDILPENEEARDLVVQGAHGYVLNKITNLATTRSLVGPNRTDFSSLAPLDMYGTYDFLHSLVTGKFTEIIPNTPAGSLFFGNNPRITNLINETAKFMNVQDEFESETEFRSVMKKTAELASGMSAMFRARLAMEAGVRKNAFGTVVDSDVEAGEAFWLMFGFATEAEVLGYTTNKITYEGSQQMKKDVKSFVDAFTKHYNSNVGDTRDREFLTKAYSQYQRVFGTMSEEYMDEFSRQISNRVKDGDISFHESIIRNAGVLSPEEMKKVVMSNPALSNEEKNKLRQFFEDADKTAQEMEELYK